MKRFLLSIAALALCVPMTLPAQTSAIKVKKGAKFSYKTNMTMNLTQEAQGQEITMDSKVESDASLTAKKVGKERVDWVYDLTRMHIKMESAMLPGGGLDSSYKSKAVSFATDLAGRVTEQPDLSDGLQAVSGGFFGNIVEQMFSPGLVRGAKPGDSWEVKDADTVANPALAGLDMVINRTTKYTFESVVDTLGSRSARLRAEVTEMTIDGKGTFQGADMNIAGDGAVQTTAYYGVEDGLLVASRSEGEVATRMTISGPMQMVLPITYKVKATTYRSK